MCEYVWLISSQRKISNLDIILISRPLHKPDFIQLHMMSGVNEERITSLNSLNLSLKQTQTQQTDFPACIACEFQL